MKNYKTTEKTVHAVDETNDNENKSILERVLTVNAKKTIIVKLSLTV